MMKRYRIIFVVAMLLGVYGCSAGPDFSGGRLPRVSAYTPAPLAAQTVSASSKLGDAQTFVNGAEIPEQWWSLFKSKELDALIREALAANPALLAAEAALRQAQEEVNARTGEVYYPGVSLSAGSSHQKVSPAANGLSGGKASIFDLHHASVAVTYVFDFFGGSRREIEAFKAKVDYEKFRLEGAYLSLSGNVVTAVIQEAMLREIGRAHV